MDITLNNLSSASGLFLLTEVPNIIKVTDANGGIRASFTISLKGSMSGAYTEDGQAFITFWGETISSTVSPTLAVNKRFYIHQDLASTAASIAQALRNCGSVNAEFIVVPQGENVILYARNYGVKWGKMPNFFQTNISSSYLTTSQTDGTSSSSIQGGKVKVGIYKGGEQGPDTYVTTLEKNVYGGETAVDVSPVLGTIAEYGKSNGVSFVVATVTEGGKFDVRKTLSAETTVGYHANQSEKYLDTSNRRILINTDRGESGMTLYTYEKSIPVTLFGKGGGNVTVKAYDSAKQEITSVTTNPMMNETMKDITVAVPSDAFKRAYYVKVEYGGWEVDFEVIKPLKGTERCQRVEWRNEYGGVSFFDFTADMSDNDTVNVETYEKSVYDYYTANVFERKKIYSNDYKKSVTLTSHLMKEDGKWIFNSLMRSKKVWTYVNGEMYYIIPTSMEINEDDNYDGIYTAKLTYTYSDI